jgi:hypothetical protein
MSLHAHYLPQLSAYWKAATEMLKQPVSAGLYSTTTGRWLPYTEEELARAWEGLGKDPAAVSQALEDERGDQV